MGIAMLTSTISKFKPAIRKAKQLGNPFFKVTAKIWHVQNLDNFWSPKSAKFSHFSILTSVGHS